jgi:PIN domain
MYLQRITGELFYAYSSFSNSLLETAFTLAESKARLIPEEIYAPWKDQALLRIPRDPNDWTTVALAPLIADVVFCSILGGM